MGRKVAKNVARNKKKYWRKISTKDIEDNLEDLRVQEMTGGRRSDQPDHLLYHIDTNATLGEESKLSTSTNKEKRIERPPLDLENLNSYKILKSHSVVPPANSESHTKPDPASKSTKRLLEAQEITEKRREKRKKYQQAKQQRSKAHEKNILDKVERGALDDPNVETTYDLWNKNDEKKEKLRQLVDPQLASFMEQVNGTYDWKVPSHITKKPSKLPAIDNPLPGMSYNPTYEDHQDLLRKALDVELEKKKKQDKLERSLPALVPFAESIELKKSWMKEMSSGIFEDETAAKDNDDDGPTLTTISVGKPVKVDPKTTQQRNKEKLRKKQEASLKSAKEKRMREHQLLQMKSIRKNVEKHLDEQKKRQQKRKIEYENRENYGTKKFGRYKFEAPDLDLNLSDEITGNLRTMKTEGNILHDRFKSFQKRNIIETRIRAKPTKTKMKKYEKRSVREVGETYQPK